MPEDKFHDNVKQIKHVLVCYIASGNQKLGEQTEGISDLTGNVVFLLMWFSSVDYTAEVMS